MGDPHNATASRLQFFSHLPGRAAATQRLHAMLGRVAASAATVLLEGETGTGKSALAAAVHRASGRAGPFVVVDCGSIPPALIESELFGHEKGAFTGADRQRPGVLELADGGTVFLDEIGELPLELQPRLLRVIEERTVRRVGGIRDRVVDVRVIAATCRRLQDEARAGRFRHDLFHRLAVAHLVVPALRERPEDIPLIARTLLGKLGASPAVIDELLDGARLAELAAGPWPGNVRELRNVLERLMVFGELAPQPERHEPGELSPYSHARRVALDTFERNYVTALLHRHDGNVAAAAASAGLHRVHLFRLIRRHRAAATASSSCQRA